MDRSHALLRRLVAEILMAEVPSDTAKAYGLDDGGAPTYLDEEDPVEETDALSFDRADRELDGRGKRRLWRRFGKG